MIFLVHLFLGVPCYDYSRLYPQNPRLIMKAPILENPHRSPLKEPLRGTPKNPILITKAPIYYLREKVNT